MKTPIEIINKRIRDVFQEKLNWGQMFRQTFAPELDCDDEAETLDDLIEGMRNQLNNQIYDKATLSEAKTLVGEHSDKPTTSLSETVSYACEGILRAKIEAYRILAAKLRGEFHLTAPIDQMFAGMHVTALPPLPGEKAVAVMTLQSASEKFTEYKRIKGNKKKTLGDLHHTMVLAFDVIDPNKRIIDVNINDVRNFRDLLGKIPRNCNKLPQTKNLSPKEAANPDSGLEVLAPNTQRKKFSEFMGMLQWLRSEEYIDNVPGEELRIAASSSKTIISKPYSTEQLKKVLSCPIYAGRRSLSHYNLPGNFRIKDYLYWVPLIALFSGMRSGEILQLNKADIKTKDGVAYFDISKWEDNQDDLDKSLKTEASERRVPVHSELIRLGFLDYVKAQPQARIFAKVKKGSDGTFSQNYSKQWRVTAQKGGFYTIQTVFHSFRHNFVDACREAEIPHNIAMQLVGHKDTSVHGGYGKGVSLEMLKEEIDKISYPVDIPGSDWSF